MADITVTPASVLLVSGGQFEGPSTDTVLAGQVVYLDPLTNGFKLAQCDGIIGTPAGLAEATVRGIALHAASPNQPLTIQTGGVIAIGATIVVGAFYVLSVNLGGIAPVADLASGSYVSQIGIAILAGQIQLAIVNTGIKHV